ncbi:helix-turn-helix domain-containing protein [Virgisporangium ochraceum]|uniref:PucR C-terminal helix-turn-helix domain-containing protein n=1 Tax=Virgisporangium ochraceum TaxID=65505 RepID=A0A8J3ZYF3_9ACTN|nr:helix-turn-helix domain-containing protein [Virgisporangium ochraceum]GIJ70538.1 hypothetical protein Voc01_054550 [Virgisporangium ochraceum]
MEPGDVQRELDGLAATLGRSVSLDDPDGTLIGYSTQGADVDPVRVQAILSRRVPEAVLAYQRGHGVDTATGPVRLPANADLGMSARTCVPVRDGRAPVAYLWVLDDGAPLDRAADDAVRACADRLATLLRAPGVDGALAELFGDRPRADPVGELVGREPRIRSHELRFAVVAATTTTDGRRAPAPRTTPPVATSRAVLGTAAAHGRRLVLLAHSGRAGAVDVGAVAGSHVTGYSAPFRAGDGDPALASALAARAIVAADCAAVDPALPATVGWDHLGVHRRLLLAGDPGGWPDPLPIADDDRSAAMLRQTLETYLDNAGDAARTITALRIHRTTFYYRLERLAAVHGIALDDGLVRTELHLALKTHRLARARDTYGWTARFLTRLR